MSTTVRQECVWIVLVSHSEKIADGVAELLRDVAGPDMRIMAVGGGPGGILGTDATRIEEVLRSAEGTRGGVVLTDIGSSLLATRAVLARLEPERRATVALADAPLVEGSIAAAVAASTGAPLEDVVRAAEEAWHVGKL